MAATAKINETYAEALFQLAGDDIEPVESELLQVSSVLQENDQVWKFFSAPVIEEEEKLAILNKTLKDQITGLMYNFLGTLVVKGRLGNLPGIAESYSEMLDHALNRKKVTVYTAIDLKPDQESELEKVLKGYFGKRVIMTVKNKPGIIGGLVIDSGDTVIDSSLRSSLQRLSKKLHTIKILGEEYYEN